MEPMSKAEANDEAVRSSRDTAHSTTEQGEKVIGMAAQGEEPLSIANPDLIEQLNRGYVCPPDAGPAWRAAHEAGVDMALIEDALQMSPEKRLQEHQRALNLVLSLASTRPPQDSGS